MSLAQNDGAAGVATPWTTRRRVLAVIQGQRPDRLPFADRLEIWYRHHKLAGTLPEGFETLSLSAAHRHLGIGEESFSFPTSVRLRGVEMISRFEGEIVRHETDPVVNHFPDTYDSVPSNHVGSTETEYITPVGTLTVEHTVHEFMVESGVARPFLRRFPVRSAADYDTAVYILERAEPVLQAARVKKEAERVGEDGYAVPLMRRIPFQQLLLEYLGPEELFNGLYDHRSRVERLLEALDAHTVQMLHALEPLDEPYVEFCDNIEGSMTSPRLYVEYGLPAHQRYTDILHAQGKKVGSHADGNLKPLLDLLRESGLDVCESVTPAPVTDCPFEVVWEAWKDGGPLIWGGIPSVLLDAETSEAEFREYFAWLFELVEDRPMILGIGDMVMPHNIAARIRYVAREAAAHELDAASLPGE